MPLDFSEEDITQHEFEEQVFDILYYNNHDVCFDD